MLTEREVSDERPLGPCDGVWVLLHRKQLTKTDDWLPSQVPTCVSTPL